MSYPAAPEEASLPKNARVQAEAEAMETAEENAGRSIITIDESSLHQIPKHLEKLLKSMAARKLTAQSDLINGLVVAVALECGFVGDWSYCDDVKTYALSWSYSFCRQLLDFASYPPKPEEDGPQIFKFVFSLDPQNVITLYSLESDELLFLSANLNGEVSATTSVKTVALPCSRFIRSKKFNLRNLPANFQNLRDLSILLKDKLFLPLRNEIYHQSICESQYPSLDGCPADVTLKIMSYLKLKDIASLSAVCKIINETAVPYLRRNKYN